MGSIETKTYASGFWICLIQVAYHPTQNALAYEVVLFEGGIERKRITQEPTTTDDPGSRAQLRSILPRVIAPPHILCVSGAGRHLLIEEAVPDYVSLLRILDLHPTSALLIKAKSTASGEELAAAYHLPYEEGLQPCCTVNDEALLWACIAHADRQGLDWDDLLSLTEQKVSLPTYGAYDFTEEHLATMTESPGVYIMRGTQDQVLYIGKAANLARRLADYFRASLDPSDKLLAIRSNIHRFDIRETGSELEALLLENYLIDELSPEINVQRNVAEGSSRYGSPITPRAVLTPAADRRKKAVFFIAPDRDTVQVTFDLSNPPERRLARLVGYVTGYRDQPPKGKGITNWGCVGRELAERHLAAHPEQVHWMELTSGGDTSSQVQTLLRCMESMATRDVEPGEFRP